MLELTGDIGVLPALLIACAAAHGVTVLLMRRSILTEKVARRGHHITREYIVNPLARMWVEDVMEREVPVLAADMAVAEVVRRLAEGDPAVGHRHAWPVLSREGELVGLVTRADLVRALERNGPSGGQVVDAAARSLVVTYPDELMSAAVDRMVHHGIGRLLVVDRRHPTRLLGYLGRTGIATAWRGVLEEEQVREAGWVTSRVRLLRRNVKRVLANDGDVSP